MSLFLAAILGVSHAQQGLPSGMYRLDLQLATETRVPVFGVTRGHSTSVVLVALDAQPDGTARQRHTTCSVSVQASRSIARVEVPDAFIQAHPIRALTAELSTHNGSARYTLDLGEDAVGWDPLLADRMPHDAAHASVTDWEGDGHPGGTIRLSGVPIFDTVELYIAQHAHVRLHGVVENGAVHGAIDVAQLDQRTLGASVPMFGASLKMHADPARSAFRLSPVSPDSTCMTLSARPPPALPPPL